MFCTMGIMTVLDINFITNSYAPKKINMYASNLKLKLVLYLGLFINIE